MTTYNLENYQDDHYRNPNKVSACCSEPMYEDYDICPTCHEHTSVMYYDEEDGDE